MPLQAAAHSEKGKRPANQDMVGLPTHLTSNVTSTHVLSLSPDVDDVEAIFREKGYLFLISDGVGGVAGGEIASQTAVEQVWARYYYDPSTDLPTSLHRVIEATNSYLRTLQMIPSYPSHMAATLTAAVLKGSSLLVAHVGDTRAYVVGPTNARQITSDHSWVQTQIDQGHVQGNEPYLALRRNELTRCLGMDHDVGVDLYSVTLRPDDRILLCSDGLSGYIDAKILITLANQRNLRRAVLELTNAALQNGSRDNISVLIIAR